jgi:RHS repeat-associated protein
VFGAETARTGSTASIGKFTGEQADDGTGDSGYYFLRARHYDPATGRFVGKDKIEFAQRYAYAECNPATWTDPTGLWSINGTLRAASSALTVVGAVAGAGTVACQVAVIASAGTAAGACLAIGAVAVIANSGALVADVALRARGEPVSNGQLARSAASAVLSVGGASLGSSAIARAVPELAPAGNFWNRGGAVAGYANTVPLDVVNATLAGRDLARMSQILRWPPAFASGMQKE